MCQIQVLFLQLQSRIFFAIIEWHLLAAREITRDVFDGSNRVAQREIRRNEIVLDHLQDNRRGTDFEIRGVFRHIGIAHDDMQPAILFLDCMGLIARIDNAALIGRGARDFLTNVLRPLRNVKHRPPARAKHLAGPGEDLARHQKRDELLRHVIKIRGALGQVIFVTAVGIADEIRIVFENRQIAVKPLLAHFALGILEQVFQDSFARLVIDRDIERTGALRGGIFRMATGIEIKPGAIFQENV